MGKMVEDIGRGNISAVSVSELASGPKGLSTSP